MKPNKIHGDGPIVLGITGGVGSGKSVVLYYLQEHYGADVIEADRLAERLMQPGEGIYKEICASFSENILNSDGTINRAGLAQIVFQDPEALQRLNNIVHPMVKQAILDRIASCETDLLVLEAALLLEDGYRDICDEMWYIFVPEETRIQRLMRGRGYSRKKCLEIMANQNSEEFYRKGTDCVIDNGQEIMAMHQQVDMAMQRLGFVC